MKLLKNNKIIGPQSIPTKLFKTFNKTLSEPLTNLINLSFIKGVFPNVLKTAQILPTFKKGGKTEMNNYRPKILEKLMYKRLYTFLEENNTFCSYQFGFRPNHSTKVHILKLLNKFEKHVTKVSLPVGFILISKKLLTQ